jgi:hypothetical protein
MAKIKGIKKAVSYINANRDMHHNVILNTKTGALHVDSFIDCNSYIAYSQNDDYWCIGSWANIVAMGRDITMRDIKRMITCFGQWHNI